jgi:hypothetical protein
MPEILRIAVNVATPLALLGLLVALSYFAYARKFKHEEKQLANLPPDQRATAVDATLTRYGIEGKQLKVADKLRLIQSEMDQKHRRSVLYVIVAAIAFVTCFALAVVAYSKNPNVPDPRSQTPKVEDNSDHHEPVQLSDTEFEVVIQEGAGNAVKVKIHVVDHVRDACRGKHSVRIDGKDGTVTVALGESKLVELPNYTKRLNWSCGTTMERSGAAAEFKWVRCSLAEDGMMDWQFYAEEGR